jgi:hypothetical protein
VLKDKFGTIVDLYDGDMQNKKLKNPFAPVPILATPIRDEI